MTADPQDPTKPFACAQVVLGELTYDHTDKEVIQPVCGCLVITVNGQLWSIILPAWGLTKDVVRGIYDRTPEKFTRVEQAQ